MTVLRANGLAALRAPTVDERMRMGRPDALEDWRERGGPWLLDPALHHLNHGSFGAGPGPVLAEQSRLRERMERDPVRFLGSELEGLLDEARAALAAFVGASPDDLVFVPNATTGINAVLRSLPLRPGDELLVTDHEYNATRNALEFAAREHRAAVRVVAVPFPCAGPEQVLDAVLASLGPRTRLVMVDHVTSPTGIVLPIEAIAGELARRGIELLVDGAHGPGMLDLDLGALLAQGVTYYTGNCHKWLCAPRGAAFLVVQPDRQQQVRPAVISHGANSPRKDRSRYQLEFGWTGTQDPTAYLAVPAAIAHLAGSLPGGWTELRDHNRRLALAAREVLAAALQVAEPAPVRMIGSLVSLPLPPAPAGRPQPLPGHDALQQALAARHGIVVPVMTWPSWPHRLLRISAQLYNDLTEYALLAAALPDLLREEAGS
jgi:isopenicillin-N epimerase